MAPTVHSSCARRNGSLARIFHGQKCIANRFSKGMKNSGPSQGCADSPADFYESLRELVEAAGIEPASLTQLPAATTCLVRCKFSIGG